MLRIWIETGPVWEALCNRTLVYSAFLLSDNDSVAFRRSTIILGVASGMDLSDALREGLGWDCWETWATKVFLRLRPSGSKRALLSVRQSRLPSQVPIFCLIFPPSPARAPLLVL